MSIFGKLFGKPYATIDGSAAREITESGGILVDVRSQVEWNAGHAPAARHIPVELIDRKSSELPAGVPIVTVCRSGARAAAAARTLAAKGFEVASVRGGMTAWQRAGGRVVAKNGREGTV